MEQAIEVTEEFRWQGRTIRWGRAGSGPNVVFCHGTPFSSVVWQPYARALSRDHTVHLWDMPGYGRSSKRPEDPVDFGAQAEAFAALLAHWGLDRDGALPHVVAHDFGGAVSLRAHLYGGARYASLMLVDVVAIPPSGSPFFRFVGEHPDLLGELPAYVHAAIVREYIRGASHRGLRDEEVVALLEPWTGPEGQPAFYRQIAQYDENYLVANESRLGGMDLPVHVVWGRQDPWIPLATGERLHGLIPGATMTTIEGGGHLMQYDVPVELSSEVRRWLAGRV